MTLSEKQAIAAAARTLIRLLKDCDDTDYAEEVADCVADLEVYPCIDSHYM